MVSIVPVHDLYAQTRTLVPAVGSPPSRAAAQHHAPRPPESASPPVEQGWCHGARALRDPSIFQNQVLGLVTLHPWQKHPSQRKALEPVGALMGPLERNTSHIEEVGRKTHEACEHIDHQL